MTITNDKKYFAPMDYLDKELEEYGDGFPDSIIENYYEALKIIRDAQKGDSALTEMLYENVGKCKRDGYQTAEYGYYMANIHYYLFDDCSEYQKIESYKKSLNIRILHFLKSANMYALFHNGWFPLNFPLNYLSFLEDFYGKKRLYDFEINPINEAKALVDFVDLYGDAEEKETASLVFALNNEFDVMMHEEF